MATITLKDLDERLSQMLYPNEWIEELVTTNLTTDANVVSTNLKNWTGSDTYFDDWWVYIVDKNNIGAERKVNTFTYSTGALACRGSDFSSDSAAATFRLYRHSFTEKKRALVNACRRVYPVLFKSLDNITLVTGNLLPNSHFQDWASSLVPDKWALTNATSTQDTTAGEYRGGASSSVKVTASSANGYLALKADNYNRLLDSENKTVPAYVWAYPETADDAAIVLYTLQADGTEQTLTSTTSCPAGKWTLIEFEDQTLNDDLVDFQFRLKVATNGQYVIFDHARLIGKTNEYLLPLDFQKGTLAQVHLSSGDFDSIHPKFTLEDRNWDIVTKAGDKYLWDKYGYSSKRLMRLVGYQPLEALSAATDTLTLDDHRVDLLLFYAAHILFGGTGAFASSEDTGRFDRRANMYLGSYYEALGRLGMGTPNPTLRF